MLQSASITGSRFWVSYTYNNFHYADFVQFENNYSGNKLPSVPAHTINSGFTFNLANLTAAVNYLYNSKIPLNDANSRYANEYHLLGTKLTWTIGEKTVVKIFTGADNILDETYSLGNDINGFGGRYYNTAPKRNYFAGINISLPFMKQ